MWGCSLCLNILLEPIWSLPDRPSQSDSLACSGGGGQCSQTVSQTLSGRWCWPQRCLKGARGQMAYLKRKIFSHSALCVYIRRSVLWFFTNLSPSPSPPADDDSLHRCCAPWSSWPDQKYVTRPWQNAAVSSTHAHYWRKDPLRQRETTQQNSGRDQEAGLVLLTLMCCIFMWFTWVPWINPGHHRAVRPIHKVVGLCHYGFLHHLPPRNKHCFVSSQTNAEHIPINISKLWMQEQRISGLLSKHVTLMRCILQNNHFLWLR